MNRTTVLKKITAPLLKILVLGGLILMFVPSCMHDPTEPVIPDPGDTTGNPIDTTGNPIDTLGGIDTTGYPCSPDTVYFYKDVLPILVSNCAQSKCHDAISHEEGLVLDSYAHVMAGHIVRANDLNRSDLYKVITSTNSEKRMPRPPAAKLTSDQIAIIAKWIQQGAKDLTCNESYGSCDTTNVTYSGVIKPMLDHYCTGCHSGASPSGNITLTSHADVQAVALNGKLLGAVSWSNGYQKMPKGGARWSACNINKLQNWIEHGAPNN